MRIHPGEMLAEVLQDRDMSIKELAVRADVEEKLVGDVVNGKANISAEFAERLENVLGIDRNFWVNLQNIYDDSGE